MSFSTKNGTTTDEAEDDGSGDSGFMAGEPMNMGEFDFLSAEDNFTSNIDTENHLRFFVDTLAVLRQKGEEQAVSAGMTQTHSQAMNRLIQTHTTMLQHFQANANGGGLFWKVYPGTRPGTRVF